MPLSKPLLTVLLFSLLAACGGGGSSGTTPAEGTQMLEVLASTTRSGTIGKSDVGDTRFESVDAGSHILAGSVPLPASVGGGTDLWQVHGVMDFDLGAVPATATIVSAVLRTSHIDAQGMPYFNLGGEMRVGHVDFGATVEGADFDTAPLVANLGALSLSTTNGDRSLDVTAAVQADHTAARVRSTFRVYFPVVGTAAAQTDTSILQDPVDLDGTGSQRPVLVITWMP